MQMCFFMVYMLLSSSVWEWLFYESSYFSNFLFLWLLGAVGVGDRVEEMGKKRVQTFIYKMSNVCASNAKHDGYIW